MEAGGDNDDADGKLAKFEGGCWKGTARRLVEYGDEALGGSVLSVIVMLGTDTWPTCRPFTPYAMLLPNWAVCGT
jgi:hypothetical protein